MAIIITSSALQKNIGKIPRSVQKKPCIMTTNGKPTMVLLPYFEDNEELLEEYFEQFEIAMNQKALQKELKESSESGLSDLVI